MRYNIDAPIKLNGIFCNEAYGQAMIACEAGNDYSVELKKNTLTINDATSSLTTIEDNLSNFAAPIYVFCECNNKQNTTLEARRHQPMRLYSMEIVEIDPETSAETAKRNFIPCLNDHGKFGLWDSVEGVFYGNQASGADFVGGNTYTAKADEKLELPSVSLSSDLRGESAATSEIEVDSVSAGSVVLVHSSLKKVTLDSVGDGVRVIAASQPGFGTSVTLALPAGQMIDSLTVEQGMVVYLESGMIGSLEGAGKVIVCGEVKYGAISSDLDVKIESNCSLTPLALGDVVLPSVLGNLPALWLDASDETTFQEYTYNGNAVPEGTFPGIVARRWDDCRGGCRDIGSLGGKFVQQRPIRGELPSQQQGGVRRPLGIRTAMDCPTHGSAVTSCRRREPIRKLIPTATEPPTSKNTGEGRTPIAQTVR